MATPQIKFALRKDGYAMLTLDQLATGAVQQAARTNGQGLTVPPRRTPLVDQKADQSATTTGLNRTWYIFLEGLANQTQQALGSDLELLKFLCPSIDEEDILTRGSGSSTLDASTNPATFTPDLGGYYSRYGVTLGVGDWIIWTDNCEIDRIVSANNGTWTVERGDFASFVGAHSVGALFYRLEPRIFFVELPDGKMPELAQFPWANKCVAAVRGWAVGSAGFGPAFTLNLNQATFQVPGWRTMNGAEYLIGIPGTLAVNERAAFRVPVAAWESLRCVYASILTPSTGADVVVSVVYIAPGDIEAVRVCGLITKCTIPAGGYRSWSAAAPPDLQQMPYPPSTFPPNLFPSCGVLGALAAPVTVDPSTSVLFAPDGEIELVVEQTGSTGTEGQDLLVTVQT